MDKRRKEKKRNLELKVTPSPLKKGKKEKTTTGRRKKGRKRHVIYRVE